MLWANVAMVCFPVSKRRWRPPSKDMREHFSAYPVLGSRLTCRKPSLGARESEAGRNPQSRRITSDGCSVEQARPGVLTAHRVRPERGSELHESSISNHLRNRQKPYVRITDQMCSSLPSLSPPLSVNLVRLRTVSTRLPELVRDVFPFFPHVNRVLDGFLCPHYRHLVSLLEFRWHIRRTAHYLLCPRDLFMDVLPQL